MNRTGSNLSKKKAYYIDFKIEQILKKVGKTNMSYLVYFHMHKYCLFIFRCAIIQKLYFGDH